MKNFVLVGAAGYIAPRHMKAIKDTGNNLLAAVDPFDSVGVIDSYFPEAAFFKEFERFDRHCEKLKNEGTLIDYVVICSPNYLHDAHIRFGLRLGSDVICEKPIVLNPWNVEALMKIEQESKGSIFNILQLRLHESVKALKSKVESAPDDKVFDIDLTYITARGKWYQHSWKGDISKSGGIATNIGVHFFDMLIWIFGDVIKSDVLELKQDRAKGILTLERAKVNWNLGINYEMIPEEIKIKGARTYRSLVIEDEEFEFSGGFTELHTESYKQILMNSGFKLENVKKSIQLVHDIRNFNLQ